MVLWIAGIIFRQRHWLSRFQQLFNLFHSEVFFQPVHFYLLTREFHKMLSKIKHRKWKNKTGVRGAKEVHNLKVCHSINSGQLPVGEPEMVWWKPSKKITELSPKRMYILWICDIWKSIHCELIRKLLAHVETAFLG